jgi:hypothetical protein
MLRVGTQFRFCSGVAETPTDVEFSTYAWDTGTSPITFPR